MPNENGQTANPKDPTVNVKEMIAKSSERLDDLRKAEVRRIDEKIESNDDKYQIQFSDSKEAILTALATVKESGNKADSANEKRFDAVNDSTSKLSEQQAKLLARTEYETGHAALTEKIDGVESRINRTEGVSSFYVTHSDLTNALDNQSNKFELMLRPVITYMNSQSGKEAVTDPAMVELTKAVKDLVGTKSQGISASWSILLGAVGLISTIIGIVLVISRFLPAN